MNIDPQTQWFGPRRYGWGWGPASWQGWAVIGAYLVLSILGVPLLLDAQRGGAAFAFQSLLTVALIIVCIVRGGAPSWRWGGRNTGQRSRHGGR